MISKVVFLFWFTLVAKSTLIHLFFSKNATDAAQGTLVSSALIVFFAFIIFLMSYSEGGNSKLKVFRYVHMKICIIFLIWMVITLYWTEGSKGSAFGYWGSLIVELSTVILVLKLSNVEKNCVMSLKGYVAGNIYIAVLALLTAGVSDDRLGTEVTFHPNTIGHLMSLGCLVTIFFATTKLDIKINKTAWTVLSLLFMMMVFRTLSKTSIAAFFTASMYYILRAPIGIQRRVVLIVSVFLATALLLTQMEAHIATYLAKDGGNVAGTLSGRTFLWADVWEKIQQQPLLGYGIRSFGIEYIVPHSHNEWLTIWYSYGLIGLTLVIGLYISFSVFLFKSRHEKRSREVAVLASSILVLELVRGFSEANSLTTLFPLSLLFLFTGWISYYKKDGSK